MMEETLADANRPSHCVEFGGKDAVGIPSPEPIPPGASGGARSDRVVCSLWPIGQGDRRQHGDHPEKGFPLAQALPGAGRQAPLRSMSPGVTAHTSQWDCVISRSVRNSRISSA